MERDTLFQAMTRPASRWGVTLEWMVVNITITLVVFIGANSFWAFGVGVVLHPIGVVMFRRDPYQLQIIATWVARCSASRARRALNQGSYYP